VQAVAKAAPRGERAMKSPVKRPTISIETSSFLGSHKPIEVIREGYCRVCGQKAVEPATVIRIDRRWLLIALALVLYVLFDVAENGRIDGSIARWLISLLTG
jgi:hypothetical protein